MYGQGKIRNDSLQLLTPSFSVQKGKDFQIVMKNAPQNSEFFLRFWACLKADRNIGILSYHRTLVSSQRTALLTVSKSDVSSIQKNILQTKFKRSKLRPQFW